MNVSNWWLRWGKNKEQSKKPGEETKVFKRIKGNYPPQPQLAVVVIDGPDQGREFLLAPNTVKIGRQAECHIQLNDPKVSRDHAVLQYYPKKKAFLLRDLGSTNGTFFNNQRIDTTFIFPGAEIRTGETVLKVLALSKKRAKGLCLPE
ncbi:MAG TPA: hypothetical protein DDW93_07540 [Firmicutes bacterium]|jgi:pSer/pThr/pTyr-binding forkhead associated (FHA) protein|nr:hypothetical protein [Bacillota bacterium]HBK68997.1 hypothetical protein [Bacillota bacterium]HBT18145.1 hypothetical protein [Bacillota bacterium]